MNKGTKIFNYGNGHELYMSDGIFLCNNVTNWKYNRPPDLVKVSEICKILQTKSCVEGIIYIAHYKNKFFCYDGNHRLEALKILNNKKLVIYDIMNVNTNEEIEKRFKEINKSNPVPELYMNYENENNQKLKKIIEQEVSTLCVLFTKHRSASNNPNRPNFNRDIIINKLYSFFKNKNIDHLTTNNLHTTLINLNNKYANGKHINLNKYSNKMIQKCKRNGCFLFLKDFTEDM